ncbi:VanZ family protein [Omnitrophica bacterium]|nr:VanZ family protein [Candidatus Omnitrophota bacterium]
MNLHFRLSKVSSFIFLWIIISTSFMLQVTEFARTYLSERTFGILTIILLIIPISAFAAFIIFRKRLPLSRVLVISALLIMALLLAMHLEYPVEKIHILEFIILGWFVTRDSIKANSMISGILLACIFSLAAGALDEAFQIILPYRVFDWRDISLNAFGGLEGVVLYLLSEK